MYLLAPFILQNFLKNLMANPELWGCAVFGTKMAHLSWTIFFLLKTIIITFIYLLAFFNVQNLKKFFQQIQSYEDAQFLGPFPQMRIFFKKPVNEPCFFYPCLSTCQKSKSDINLLVKYWRLKNTKISLAKSHFWL